MAPESKITCPITMKELNGFNKFIVYWGCGCIVSRQARQEIGSKDDENQCILCQATVNSPHDIIDLNMTDEEKALKYRKMMEENVKEKKCKKRTHTCGDKKQEKEDEEEVGAGYKKQKVEPLTLKKTSVFASMFHKDSDVVEGKDKNADFMSRCSRWGLR